jgi:histidinol phosphatase-like enzyme (inositol monophosphatase family)
MTPHSFSQSLSMPPAQLVPKPVPAAELLAVAHDLADAAGKRILPYFRKTLTIENKHASGGFDPVTIADKAAERVMRQAIRKRFPDHAITGEEFAAHDSASRYRWVLDPIDGTRGFMCGLPTWGTLIGLMDGAVPIFGMMDQPYTRDRFWAVRGKAQTRGADGKVRPLKTRACAALDQAVLSTTSPEMFTGRAERAIFEGISRDSKMIRYGADCFAYAMLAAGHIDVVIEAGLKEVDIVALIPIIEAAGGYVTSWTGGSAAQGGNVLASGDPRLHEKLLRTIG